MSGLRPVAEHRAALLAGLEPLPAVRVATAAALGLVLAESATAAVDLPGFDNSAMDGYAVRAVDLSAAGGQPHEVTLPVVADIAAGDTRQHSLSPGAAARIMTGAPLPVGADAVVPVEDSDGGVATVRLAGGVEVGRHIRRQGEDVRVGEVLLEPGVVLTPGRIALLAAANVAQVSAYRAPRVTIFSTGDELLPLGSAPGHGQIIDSNQLMLAALVQAAGGVLAHVGHLPDEPDAVRAAFAAPPGDPDLVLTTGGVSMGAHDTVKEVLRALGGVDFVKVAMRPGMPQGAGRLARATSDDCATSGNCATQGDSAAQRDSATGADGIPVITLPGNPVSSFVSFHVFALPVLRRLAGRDAQLDERVVAAGAAWRGAAGKTEFTRVRVEGGVARPERGQGSHMLGALAGANALAVVEGEVGLGDPITVIPFVGEG